MKETRDRVLPRRQYSAKPSEVARPAPGATRSRQSIRRNPVFRRAPIGAAATGRGHPKKGNYLTKVDRRQFRGRSLLSRNPKPAKGKVLLMDEPYGAIVVGFEDVEVTHFRRSDQDRIDAMNSFTSMSLFECISFPFPVIMQPRTFGSLSYL